MIFTAFLLFSSACLVFVQEFNKLLMSLLERCLQRSAPPLCGLVSGLFSGELSYVTRCLSCNTASKNKNIFNELELQIGVSHHNGNSGRMVPLENLRTCCHWQVMLSSTVRKILSLFVMDLELSCAFLT